MTETIEEPELKRNGDVLPYRAAATSKWYIIGSVTTCIATMMLVSVVAVFRPDPITIAAIIGFGQAIAVGLMGMGIQANNHAVDGRLTQLIITKSKEKKYEGIIEGLQANPNINVTDKSINVEKK